jgi:putative heme iron utilization protein
VFHYRNFKQELPRTGKSHGYHEADPQQAANDLFGHLKEGDKIAIVTRFSDSAQSYVDALRLED